jgi:large subunit ribosomal protein L23
MKNRIKGIHRPHVTEKMEDARENARTYAFEVHPDLNKIEVKRAIEEKFGVVVQGVRTMHVTGKVKRMGRHEGKRKDWKKAIVTLAEGHTIELFEGV